MIAWKKPTILCQKLPEWSSPHHLQSPSPAGCSGSVGSVGSVCPGSPVAVPDTVIFSVSAVYAVDLDGDRVFHDLIGSRRRFGDHLLRRVLSHDFCAVALCAGEGRGHGALVGGQHQEGSP